VAGTASGTAPDETLTLPALSSGSTGPGLINWVTQGTHLGLYRNYFGQDIDDNFISDNEWSSQFQCTPSATDPPDYNCPVADQGAAPGSGAGIPADVQMSAADVAYVINWEQQTGIKLNLAFNAAGACTSPSAADESNANCAGSYTDNGVTYTDPGQVIDASYPNDADLVNALLADQADFNWTIRTWSHQFLGQQASAHESSILGRRQGARPRDWGIGRFSARLGTAGQRGIDEC
jgi:hypothetical protein